MSHIQGQSLSEIVDNLEYFEDLLTTEEEHRLFEQNAGYDDKAERYGDPCSRCGCLTWGGDCPNCWDDGSF